MSADNENNTGANDAEYQAWLEAKAAHEALQAELEAGVEILNSLRIRVLKDEAGETYFNDGDIAHFLLTWAQLQMKAVQGDAGEVFMSGAAAAIQNLGAFLNDEDQHIAPTSVADVPDTIPADWLS